MVNATQMCKAAGKRWILYYNNNSTKSYIQSIKAKVRIRTLDLIRSNRGGDHSGTMVHLLIALNLASWLSEDVRLQFNMWNAELLLTGRVELGNEINVQQLAPSTPSCCTNTNGAEIIEFVLKLSNGADFIVPVRRDGYVNVTKICQAAGKRLQNYKDRLDSKHFLDRYVALTGIQANAIFEVMQGGNLANVEQGSGARKPLVLNGLVIEVDRDTFMVNATQMCKSAGKRWILYYNNNSTKSYIQSIKAKVGIPTFDLIQSKPGHNGGTMVHRLIAYDLASWLSDDVKIQFNMWISELLLTGRVELGN